MQTREQEHRDSKAIERQFADVSAQRSDAAETHGRDLAALQTRMRAVEISIDTNTKLTASIGADTSELLDMFRAAKGFFKFAGWVGNAVKWTAGLAAAFAALYAFVKNIKGG